MDRLLTLIDQAVRIWHKILRSLDIPGDVMLFFMTSAVTWQIFKGHDVGPSNAACYATAVTGLVAWKIKKQ